MSQAVNTENFKNLLDKTTHWDKDERYMATNDLCVELSKDISMDENLERRVCNAVIKQLDDKSNDVQSVAVKCLALLLKKVQPAQLGEICEKLCSLLLEGTSELRDIYSIGLKNLITETSESNGALVTLRAAPNLLRGINYTNANATVQGEVRKECVENMTELLRRFGFFVSAEDQRVVFDSVFGLLLHTDTKAIIRKRSAFCLGSLAVVASDSLLDTIVSKLLDSIAHANQNLEDKRILVQCVCTISRAVGSRLGAYLPSIIPLFLNSCGEPNDEATQDESNNELREHLFPGLESFVLSCPSEQINPFLSDILKVATGFMKYDPNYFGDDEDEMDVEEQEEEEEYDYGDEYDEPQDMGGDDADSSWKVRKAAVKVIRAVLSCQENVKEKQQLVYEVCGSEMVKRFSDRVESVRLDVIECFQRLVSATTSSVDITTDNMISTLNITDEPQSQSMGDEVSNTNSNSRPASTSVPMKRQRSETDVIPLHFILPQIVTTTLKLFKVGCDGKTLSSAEFETSLKTKCALLRLLAGLCMVLREDEVGFLGLVTETTYLLDYAVLFVKNVSSASTHEEHLRYNSLLFIRTLIDTHSVEVLQSNMQKLLPAIINDVLVIETHRASDEYMKALVIALNIVSSLVDICVAGAGVFDYKAYVSPVFDCICNYLRLIIGGGKLSIDARVEVMGTMSHVLTAFGESVNAASVLKLLLHECLGIDNIRTITLKTLISVLNVEYTRRGMDLSECYSPDVFQLLLGFVTPNSSLNRTTKCLTMQLLFLLLELSNNQYTVSNEIIGTLLHTMTDSLSDADWYFTTQALLVLHALSSMSVDNSMYATLYPQLLKLCVSPLLTPGTVLLSNMRSNLCIYSNTPIALIGYCLVDMTVQHNHSYINTFHDLLQFNVDGMQHNEVLKIMQNVSTCIGCVVEASKSESSIENEVVSHVVSELTNCLNSEVSDTVCENRLLFAVICAAELFSGLSIDNVPQGLDTIIPLFVSCFNSSVDTIRINAAKSMGIAIGAQLNQYSKLQILVENVSAPSSPTQYLYFIAMKECFIKHCSLLKSSSGAVNAQQDMLYSTALPAMLQAISAEEEHVRHIVAESISVLILNAETHEEGSISSSLALLRVKEKLTEIIRGSDNTKIVLAYWTVANALKCCVSKPITMEYNSFLSREIMELFVSVISSVKIPPTTDNPLSAVECDIRKVALLFINCSIHYNKFLLKKYMDNEYLLNYLLESAAFVQERVVDLGPFKHTVDDGLVIRKNALVCFEALLDNSKEFQFDMNPLLKIILCPRTARISSTASDSAKKDIVFIAKDKEELRFLAFQVLCKIALTLPIGVISPYISEIISALTTLFKKLTTSSSKVDDNYLELVRAGCRLIIVLDNKLTSGVRTAWKNDFVTPIVLKNQEVVRILDSLKNEKMV